MPSTSALRSLRLLLPSNRTCLLPVARASTTSISTTADPAVHSEPPQGEGGSEETPEKHEYRSDPHRRPRHDKQQSDYKPLPLDHPLLSSPKLESNPINTPVDPTFQQKRRSHQYSPDPAVLADVSCVGVDGTPLIGGGGGGGGEVVEKTYGRTDEEEYREYFGDRKASPLSEIELADTRKPITRALDGEKRDDVWGGEGNGYMVEDTVDDSLARAEAMFMAAKVNGDPDSPQARALARKLWERYQMKETEFEMA